MDSRLTPLSLLAVMLGAIGLGPSATAADLKRAQLTQLIREVDLLPPDSGPQPAAVNGSVDEGTAVRTAVDSRVELRFRDNIVTRLGASTVLNFGKATGGFEIREGVAFLQVPKSAGKTRIKTNGISADVEGTTVVFESHPPTYKLLVLQGTARLYRPKHLGDSVLIRAGQMSFGSAATPVSDPVDFDVERFLATCRLITEFGPLRTETLLAKVTEKQRNAKSKKVLIDTNLVINGPGTLVSIVDPSRDDKSNHEHDTAALVQPAFAAPMPFRMNLSIDRAIEVAR
jgi:hypothetical protein